MCTEETVTLYYYKVGQFTTFSDPAPSVAVNPSETHVICPGNLSITLLPSKILLFFDQNCLRFDNHQQDFVHITFRSSGFALNQWTVEIFFHYSPRPCSFTYPLTLARLTPELLEAKHVDYSYLVKLTMMSIAAKRSTHKDERLVLKRDIKRSIRVDHEWYEVMPQDCRNIGCSPEHVNRTFREVDSSYDRFYFYVEPVSSHNSFDFQLGFTTK
ncbi:hypothetical protein CLF_111586 [Clonorchis sinensis]|uniref:Uncharacterized protein n=1 Tax=Clonorchis sinensis TaxID=79923 RepID=G7YLS1_CLOSI|nr:hypothetical protein CLF_111586 [Clonorchis sinensis]